MLKNIWDVRKERIEKQSVFWNMVSSGLNSVVSMLLLWVVTAANGVSDAGIFSLGFSTAQMMLTIGNYGMRNYQATDITHKYSMGIYESSRIITNILMMIVVLGFVWGEGYNWEKAIITILLCLLKVTDAFDDVYGGYYQMQGRLDISGKIMCIRITAYVVGFVVSIILKHDLIFSCLIAIIISSVILIILIESTTEVILLEKPRFQWKCIGKLLGECFPLCISTFLLIYLGNAPKYAIDRYLTTKDQAYYTYLFMPCFVTNLFVGFALQPLLVKLSKSWIQKEYKKFVKICAMIFGGAIAISVVIVALGAKIGCPILTIVFGVNLLKYSNILIVLLIGGAFFAFAVIEQVVLTVMRRQLYLLIGFGIASGVATLISGKLVQQFELLGAGYAYAISAGTLFGVLAIMIIIFFKIEKSKKCK